ncbi:MAG TPA: DnaJ domain-containing protein [Allosphingosinicella sp.]|nr:DnaJ domain-containing protein [Allosphingosinicella sp.]
MDRPYSLYDVLNVSPGASPAALEAAYRSLMKKHHPDRTGAKVCNEAAAINAAFSVLRDPERRADYDRREGARQRSLLDQQLHKLHRRRRIAGWGAWSAAALIVCAATAYAAQTVVLRAAPRQRIAIAADAPSPSRLDPVQLVNDVLAEAADMSLGPRPLPQKGPVHVRTGSPEPRAAARAAFAERPPALRRRQAPAPAPEAAPRRAEPAQGDFLEREDFIY